MKRFDEVQYKVAKVFRSHQAFVVLLITLLILLATFLRVQTLNNMPIDNAYIDEQSTNIKQ
jgi:hypothetical protein